MPCPGHSTRRNPRVSPPPTTPPNHALTHRNQPQSPAANTRRIQHPPDNTPSPARAHVDHPVVNSSRSSASRPLNERHARTSQRGRASRPPNGQLGLTHSRPAQVGRLTNNAPTPSRICRPLNERLARRIAHRVSATQWTTRPGLSRTHVARSMISSRRLAARPRRANRPLNGRLTRAVCHACRPLSSQLTPARPHCTNRPLNGRLGRAIPARADHSVASSEGSPLLPHESATQWTTHPSNHTCPARRPFSGQLRQSPVTRIVRSMDNSPKPAHVLRVLTVQTRFRE